MICSRVVIVGLSILLRHFLNGSLFLLSLVSLCKKSLFCNGVFFFINIDGRCSKLTPLFILFFCSGVGYAICLLDVYMGMYYNTIIGWAVYYLVASFQSELPWTSCGNEWNTANCTPVLDTQHNYSTSPAREFFE